MSQNTLYVIVTVALLHASGALLAETVEIAPVADADVDSSNPTQISNDTTVRVGRNPSLPGAPRYRVFFRFDLAAISQDAQIISAVLRLRLTGSSGGGTLPVEARAALSAWSETSLVWANQPPTASPSAIVQVGVNTTVPYDISITPMVVAWRAGTPNLGLALTAQGEAGATQARVFASKESTVTAQRPALIVSYALPPDIDVDPTSLDFGGIRVGSTSAARAVAIRNLGGEPLHVTSIRSSSAELSLSGTPPSYPATITAGGSIDLTVRFTPSAAGARPGSISVDSDDADESTVVVATDGRGLSPQIRVTPDRLDFGTELVGGVSAPRELRIKNDGDYALRVDSVASSSAEFELGGLPSGPTSLTPGAERVASVRFRPVVPGPRDGSVSISSDDPEAPVVIVPLGGSGQAPVGGCDAAPWPGVRPVVTSPACGSHWVFGQEVAFEAADAQETCPDGPYDICWYFRPFDEESELSCERFGAGAWAGVSSYQFTRGRLLDRDDARGLSYRAIPFRGHWVVKVVMCGVESSESDFYVDYDSPITGQIHPFFCARDLDDEGCSLCDNSPDPENCEDPRQEGSCPEDLDAYPCVDIDWNDEDDLDNHVTTAHFNVFWDASDILRDGNGNPVLKDLDMDGDADDEVPIGDEMRPSDQYLGLLECVYATLDHWMVAPLDPDALFWDRGSYAGISRLSCCVVGAGGGGQGVPLGFGWGQDARWEPDKYPDPRSDRDAWVGAHELFHTFDYAGNPLHDRRVFDYRYTNNAYVFFHEATPAVEQSMAGGFPMRFGYRTDAWPSWTPLDAGLLEVDYHAGPFWAYVMTEYEVGPRLEWSGPPICACEYHEQVLAPHAFDFFEEWNRRVREHIRQELGDEYDLIRYGSDQCSEVHRAGPDTHFLYSGEVDPSCYQTVEFELQIIEDIARERAIARGDVIDGTELRESIFLDFAVAFAEAFPPGSLLGPFPSPVACTPTDVSFSKGFGADDLVCAAVGNADFYARLRFRITDDSIRYLRIVANDDATLYVDGRAVIGAEDPTGSEPSADFPDASTTYADQSLQWTENPTPTSCVFPIVNPQRRTFELEWVNRRDGLGNGDTSTNRYLLALEKYDPATGTFTRFSDLGDPVEVEAAEFWVDQGRGRFCGDRPEVQLRPVVEGPRPYLLPALAAHYHPIPPPPEYTGDFVVTVRDDEVLHTRSSASLLTIRGDLCGAVGLRHADWRGFLDRSSETTQSLRVHSDGSGAAASVDGEPALVLVTGQRTVHPEAPARFRPYGTLGATHYTVIGYWPDRFDRGPIGNPPNDDFDHAANIPHAAATGDFVASEANNSRRYDLTVDDLTMHVPEDVDHFRLALLDAGPDCELALPDCVGLAEAANGILTVQAVGPLALVLYDDAGRELRRYDRGYFEITCPRATGFSAVHFAVENESDSALSYSLRIRYSVPDAEVARAMSRFCDVVRDEPGGTREDDSFRLLDPIPRVGEGFIFGANCNTIVCQPFKHDFLVFRWDETRTLTVEMESELGAGLGLDLLDERLETLASAEALANRGAGAGPGAIARDRLVRDALPPGWYLLRLTGSQFLVPYTLRFVDVETKNPFRRGDCNDDGMVDIADAIFSLRFLFLGDGDSGCDDACDSNDDGAVDISDAINTLGVLFLGNGTIPAPGMTDCGADPTEDGVGCGEYKGCP